MKPLVLDSASIFLRVKNKGKHFQTSEMHQKGPTAQQPLNERFVRHLPYSLVEFIALLLHECNEGQTHARTPRWSPTQLWTDVLNVFVETRSTTGRTSSYFFDTKILLLTVSFQLVHLLDMWFCKKSFWPANLNRVDFTQSFGLCRLEIKGKNIKLNAF